MINKPLPLNSDYSGDPNIKALKSLKKRGFINDGSTLGFEAEAFGQQVRSEHLAQAPSHMTFRLDC